LSYLNSEDLVQLLSPASMTVSTQSLPEGMGTHQGQAVQCQDSIGIIATRQDSSYPYTLGLLSSTSLNWLTSVEFPPEVRIHNSTHPGTLICSNQSFYILGGR